MAQLPRPALRELCSPTWLFHAPGPAFPQFPLWTRLRGQSQGRNCFFPSSCGNGESKGRAAVTVSFVGQAGLPGWEEVILYQSLQKASAPLPLCALQRGVCGAVGRACTLCCSRRSTSLPPRSTREIHSAMGKPLPRRVEKLPHSSPLPPWPPSLEGELGKAAGGFCGFLPSWGHFSSASSFKEGKSRKRPISMETFW